MQSEIASSIAAAMNTVLSPEEEARISNIPTENLKAYEAYLGGTRLLRRRTGAAIEAASRNFQEAIRLDPDFAIARASLAESYHLLVSYADNSEEEWFGRALNAATSSFAWFCHQAI